MEAHLKIEHLAPYLPYRLKMRCIEDKTNHILTIAHQTYDLSTVGLYPILKGDFYKKFKPILRPLSEFEYDHIVQIKEHLRIGQWCDYYDTYFDAWFDDIANIDKLVLQCPYEIMQFFLKCHFDIFNLIPQGLAISINDINK